MADKPSDSHLKEVRDGLVGEMLDQGRRMGAVLPDVRKVEQFIDPIMRRVEVDVAKEADAIPAKAPDLDKSVKGGDWYGEAGHSTKVPEGANLRSETLGEYSVNRQTGAIKPKNGAPMPKAATVLELIIKKMVAHPSWREPILAATKLCDVHMSAMPGCVFCERREGRLLEIVAKAKSSFTKQRERRLLVGGK